MLETELKAVVPDEAAARTALQHAGAQLVFIGQLVDHRYDTVARALYQRDVVLRVRTQREAAVARAQIDFKGPTSYRDGYKVRDEHSVSVGDAAGLAQILAFLGYVVTREIERDVEVYELHDAIVRFERYPRMDLLVEVEGEPNAIEAAIQSLGIARDGFTTERLGDFVLRFEARTGQRAALCAAELEGTAAYVREDA